MHAVTFSGRDQLGEDGRDAGGVRSAADVVLAGGAGGGVDDELLSGGVVRRGGLQRLHVAAVAGLGHREAAQQFQVDELLHVGLVVALGAEVFDGAAEQAPLHAGLDHERQVRHRQHLDLRHRGSDVAVAAVFLLEAVLGGPLGGHDPHLLGDLGAGDDGVGRVVRFEDLGGELLAHPVLHIAPAAVQRVADMVDGGGHIRTVARGALLETMTLQTQANLSEPVEFDWRLVDPTSEPDSTPPSVNLADQLDHRHADVTGGWLRAATFHPASVGGAVLGRCCCASSSRARMTRTASTSVCRSD